MPKQSTAEELTILRTIVGDLLKRGGGITVATIEAELKRREVAKGKRAPTELRSNVKCFN